MSTINAGIGLANLLNQIHRAHVIKGFDFNMMVAGDFGVGKSTFINMLFNTNIYENIPYSDFSVKYPSEFKIMNSLVHLNENGVNLNLEVIDVVGFGYYNDQRCWDDITDCITSRLNSHIEYEVSNNQGANVRDTRIHCCFYFIPPNGHDLRPVDIKFMKTVHKLVNLIPIISKADCLTLEELNVFKHRVMESIKENDIQIYKFPDLFKDQDDTDSKTKSIDIEKKLPFAIISSTKQYNIDGKKCFARKYPWGYIEVDGNENSDTSLLKDLFLKTHMYHLIHSSINILYENYRTAHFNNIDIDGVEKLMEERLKLEQKNLDDIDESEIINDERVAALLGETQSTYLVKLESLKKQYKETIDEKKRIIESLNRQISLSIADSKVNNNEEVSPSSPTVSNKSPQLQASRISSHNKEFKEKSFRKKEKSKKKK